ncbi:acyl-CoA thioesterase/bile acid-CoA:amino acid N-acyltransferase family protein [Nocardiopsis halophila]|uniref:acyl-CoA thioesterase/bile acid-CoA:amino acid N-acyltransferase family protein n=1 Tax=Nocardiopsis halophila TaxID=141692 RepID=UPI00034BAFCE|nr:acyl-CoA thioesterase/bile acid-CoA:amino acid N-acyltransferase family protein [Nocardiopsis halophila]
MRRWARAAAAAAPGALLLTACTTGQGPEPDVRTGPEGALIDASAEFLVEGLPPGEEAVLWLHATDPQGRDWASWASFTSDEEGRVDPASQAPEAGTYDDADAEGLLRSLRLPDGEPVRSPVPVPGEGPELAYTFGVDVGGRTVAEEEFVRLLHAPGVRTERTDDQGVVGDLYLPPGPGPHPGVLLLGGSEGGRASPSLAALMASHGLAVLSIAYFGEEGVPETLESIPLEYTFDAVDLLSGHPDVSGEGVGVMGASKGGELALLVGAHDRRVNAAVSVVGSSYVFHAPPGPTGAGAASGSWSLDGNDLPYLAPTQAMSLRDTAPGFLGRPWRLDWSAENAVEQATPQEREAATIPTERIDGPVLIISGAQDALWPHWLADEGEERRDAAGLPTERVVHPEAGHLIMGVPNLPSTYSTAAPLIPDIALMDLGGDPAANAEAVDDTFTRSVAFFKEALKEGSGEAPEGGPEPEPDEQAEAPTGDGTPGQEGEGT